MSRQLMGVEPADTPLSKWQCKSTTVYHSRPDYSTQLERHSITTLQQGSIVDGRVVHGKNVTVWIEVVVDTQQPPGKNVLCYMPVLGADGRQVIMESLSPTV